MAAWQNQGGRAPAAPMLNGNSSWAQQYAEEIRDLIERQAARAPRSIQSRLWALCSWVPSVTLT